MVVNGANDPWVFEVNPYVNEGVQLLTRAKHTGGNRRFEPVTMNYLRGASAPSGEYAERRPDVHVSNYLMEVRLPQTTTGELAFAADATLELVADTASGPWVSFYIFEKMRVDSARWADGTPAQAYIPKDSPYLWIRFDRRLEKGETRTLRLAYHGDLLDRFGDWFFIKSSIAWYPLPMEARYPALFDLTFVSPEGFLLASVGDRSDSAGAPGHMVRTRWKAAQPIRNASFNLGLFERYDIRGDSAPPVTLLWSEDMHKRFVSDMRRFSQQTGTGPIVLHGKNMKEQVGQDVSTAIQFYTHVFGPTSAGIASRG